MTTWQPLLDDDAAARAMDAVRDVRDALTPDAVAATGAGLGGGMAGIALFHAALGEATGSEAETARAIELMDAAIDEVAEQDHVDPAFFGRTVGVGWAMSRLAPRLGEDDADENDIDELVLRMLAIDPWPAHFDLVNGLTGLGAYALERLPRPSARAALDAVVRHLAAMAQRSPGSAAWFTTPAIYPVRADMYPEGHYDAGFAHGNAGVVALLAAATRAGVAGAEPLLRDAVAWLVALRGEPGDEGVFPATVSLDGERTPGRMAWCYGDLGAALALTAAGRALDDASLLGTAREVVRGCAGRTETTGIVDASLCHGTVGAAHLFSRLGRALDDEQALDLARYWFGRALDDRGPEGIVAGFVGKADPGTTVQRPTYGLVEGVAGTALALLTAATGAEPWWDFPLLVGAADA